MYLEFFLCVAGVTLLIYVATAPPGADSVPPQCIAWYAVGLCVAGVTGAVPTSVVDAVTVIPCTVLCVTTVGILFYSCNEECPLKIYILCLFL